MEKQKFHHKCLSCGQGMNEGFIVYGGLEYYCSPECLHTAYDPEEWALMNDNDEGDSHFMVWEDESDYQYIFKDGKLVELKDNDQE